MCVCVCFHVCLTTNQPTHLLCRETDSWLMCAGGRRGCREKWPLENTETQTGRSPFRVTTFWCPAKIHTRRHSPVSPATTRRSSLTASPSIFSVSLTRMYIPLNVKWGERAQLEANFLFFFFTCPCVHQMSQMFLWMGLMETGTWTERTSSWAAKLMPTQPSLCINGDCECNAACVSPRVIHVTNIWSLFMNYVESLFFPTYTYIFTQHSMVLRDKLTKQLTDGELADVSKSTQHFWSFTPKQRFSIFLNNWSRWGEKQCWRNPGHPKIREFLPQTSQQGKCISGSLTKATVSLNSNYSHVENVHNLCWLPSFISCLCCRVNGSIPSSAEIRDNVLTFKGPVTYDVQGTYVCDATNSIGTRSASVEVSIIGTSAWSLGSFHLRIRAKWKERNDLAEVCCWLSVCVCVCVCVCIFPLEKPLPQIATGDVISVVALLLAAGVLMGITITVLVLKIRSRKDDSSYVNSPLSLHLFDLACLLKVHYVVFGKLY